MVFLLNVQTCSLIIINFQVENFGSVQFGEGPSGRCSYGLPCNRIGVTGRVAETYIFGTFNQYTSQCTDGSVYYRQTTTDIDLLAKLSDDIKAFGCDGSFHASYAIISTWYKVRPLHYSDYCSFREDPLCVRKAGKNTTSKLHK